MRVLFFTECGEGIGLGHLVRCSALSKALLTAHPDLSFIIYKRGDGNINYDLGSLEVVYNVWNADHPWLKEYIRNDDIVIIDSYIAETETISLIKSLAGKTVVIDDYKRLSYGAHLIINPNLSGTLVDYRDETGQILKGDDYLLLRDDFINSINKSTISINQNIRHITVTMGGSDYRDLMPKFAEELPRLYPEIAFTFLMLSEARKEEFNRRFGKENVEFVGRFNALEMANLFTKTDLCISAGGQTLGELAYIGVPFIPVCIDNDQELNVKYFYAHDLIKEIVNWDDEELLSKIEQEINRLQPFKIRESMSKLLQHLVDGKGVQRVSNAIFNL